MPAIRATVRSDGVCVVVPTQPASGRMPARSGFGDGPTAVACAGGSIEERRPHGGGDGDTDQRGSLDEDQGHGGDLVARFGCPSHVGTTSAPARILRPESMSRPDQPDHTT